MLSLLTATASVSVEGAAGVRSEGGAFSDSVETGVLNSVGGKGERKPDFDSDRLLVWRLLLLCSAVMVK